MRLAFLHFALCGAPKILLCRRGYHSEENKSLRTFFPFTSHSPCG